MKILNNRSLPQKVIDSVTFPMRVITLFEMDKFGLSSLQSERFDYVSREVTGYCLDIGCGRHNRFIMEYLDGEGIGIDIFPYEGLGAQNLVDDLTHLPFNNDSFNTVTFIANVGHIPKNMREAEFQEAYRVLKPGGNIIIQTGNPFAELLMHKIIFYYDRLFGTQYDVDTIRGMHEDEDICIKEIDILTDLGNAGFKRVTKKYFFTQWALNHLYVGWKEKI
jgi:SAM-dependent methyltransferase